MRKIKDNTGTAIYGAFSDLIEFEGDVDAESSFISGENSALIVVSDGTILTIKYGKDDLAIWEIKLVKKGLLFISIEECTEEDSSLYSDVARFKSGVEWAYVASEWEKIANLIGVK